MMMRTAPMMCAVWLLLMFTLTACGASPVAESVSGDAAAVENVSGTASDAVSVTETRSDTDLTVLRFQAGCADAFLLTTPNGAVLIDCGEKGFGRTILAELEARGIKQLDCMIITHFDQDHVGGAARIINNFPVARILQSNSPKDSEEYEKYVKAVKTAGIEPETVRENLTFVIDGVSYTVNPPKKSQYNSDSSNNSSLIISVENGQNRLLFTGDAEDERLEEFLAVGDWGTYDFLKMPHHGRWHEALLLLVEATSPRYALITSSDDEPEDEDTLELLESFGAETFLTRSGAVLLRSDGVTLTAAYA